MIRPFKRLKAGQQLSARDYNRLAGQVEDIANIRATNGTGISVSFRNGQPIIDSKIPNVFWIKVTGAVSSGKYPWNEVHDDGAGSYSVLAEGRSGTTSVLPAYEVNDNAAVPTTAICPAWMAEGGDSINFLYYNQASAGDELVRVTSNDTTADYLYNKLAAGTGITITETNDGGDEDATIACTITQYTDEMAQDAIGGILLDSSTIDFTYDDGTPSITAIVIDASITYAKIQNISATSRILGRKTAGSGSTEECTLSQVLDFIGSAAQGDILYRGAAAWARLGAGTSGHFLKTQGAGANPTWAATSSPITVEDADSNPTDSTILTIRFDQADGFNISYPAATVAQIDFTLASAVALAGNVLIWIKVTKGYADLTDTDTVNDIEVYSLPAKGMFHYGIVKTTQSFSGGTIASYNLALGITGSLTRYLSVYDAFASVSNTNFARSTTNIPDFQNFGSATSIRLQATSSGGNLNAATAGSVDIYLLISVLP